MAQIPVFVVVKGEQDIAKLTAAIGQAEAKTSAAAVSGGRLSGVLSGIGSGIGIAGVMGVTQAIGTLTNYMQDAVAAAMDDERSQVRLGVALRDNVPGWDGQTAAIDRAITKAQRLGFEDSALRDSMGGLLARTHDVDRALQLQSTAMDLARFRGIDLQAAVDLIGKAFDGNVGALRRAGIAVDAHANAQEALAAVIAATAGQAEAYAETSLGKMEAANIRMGESAEKLGSRVLPVVADAFDLLAGTIDLATTAVDGMLLPLTAATRAHEDGAQAVLSNGQAVGAYTGYINALVGPAAAAAQAVTNVSVATKYQAINAAGAAPPTDVFAGALGRLWDTADGAWQAMRRLHVEMGAGAVPVTVLSNGMTAFGKTTADVTKASNDAILAQRQWIRATNQASGATSGAGRAMRDYSSQVSTAFDALRTKVTRAFDAIHEKNLRAIEDTRRLANAALQGQIDAIQGQVDAAQKELDAKRDAIRQAELEQAVAQARNQEERLRAQAELDDYLAQKKIDAMQADADVEIAKLKAQQDANDEKAKADTKAEEARDKAARAAFDKELEALEKHLTAKKVKWEAANKQILALLDKYGVDFTTAGNKLGTKFADGYVKGVDKALGSIAAAVAKLLGLNTAPKVQSAATGGTSAPKPPATPAATPAATPPATPAATATAAAGGAVAAQAAATAANIGSATGSGNTYKVSLAVNVGAFLGTDEDARKFANLLWKHLNDETTRRLMVWPDAATWRVVVDATTE